jgi:hypothetical protein
LTFNSYDGKFKLEIPLQYGYTGGLSMFVAHVPMNLQLFAGENDDVNLFTTDDDDLGTSVEQEISEEQPEEELSEEVSEEPAEEENAEESEESKEEEPSEEENNAKKSKKSELDDNIPWVKKRLARAERSFERKFMEEAASLSEGITVARDEIPKAVRLWNVLKYNPELSQKVEELITNAAREGKFKSLKDVRPESKVDESIARIELKEAQLDLRYTDPIFRKYEKQIMEYAEDEGIEINSAKALKLAYKAWKGENARLLMADAEKKAQQKAVQKTQTRKAAALASGRSPVKSVQIDYRKASDKEILNSMGLKLFTEDE